MKNKILLLLVLVGGVFALIFLKFGNFAESAGLSAIIPTPPATINVCVGHGGPNCSVINQDASVMCNDGTVDTSVIIYAVPQCANTLSSVLQKQMDFVTTSGCYPPSEIACTNKTSYQNLSKILTTSGLANSELGKDELVQCTAQIKDYQSNLVNYKQCLAKNNNANFNLPAQQMVKPLLKAIFCPIFYGGYVSYDDKADLCVCDSGYFMSNGKCTNATAICQSKYGVNSDVKNGTCTCAKGYRFNSSHAQCVK